MTNGAYVVMTSRHKARLVFPFYFAATSYLIDTPFAFSTFESIDLNYTRFVQATMFSRAALACPRLYDHNGDYVFKWVFFQLLLQYIDGEPRTVHGPLEHEGFANVGDFDDGELVALVQEEEEDYEIQPAAA